MARKKNKKTYKARKKKEQINHKELTLQGLIALIVGILLMLIDKHII